MRASTIWAAGALLALTCSGAVAWPDEPTTIRVIVGSPSGGGTDAVTRAVAAFVERDLGNATLNVINMPGAGGELGITEVAKSAPDGTTFGIAVMPNLVTRVIEKDPPNFTLDELTFLGFVDSAPGAIAVPPASEFETLEQLVAFAKENPGVATMAVSAIGADNHLAILRFMNEYDVQFTVIPFGGDDTARNAIMGGHVTAGAISANSSFTYADLMRTIAVTSEERLDFLPEIPTALESGYNILGGSSRGFIAPAGLPDEIRTALAGSIEKALNDPQVIEEIKARNIFVDYKSPEEYEAYVRGEFDALSVLFQELPWIE